MQWYRQPLLQREKRLLRRLHHMLSHNYPQIPEHLNHTALFDTCVQFMHGSGNTILFRRSNRVDTWISGADDSVQLIYC